MNTFAINSIEDIFELIYTEISTNEEKNISLGDALNIRIILSGNQWDGAIDYRICEFVQLLQEKVLHIYNDLYDKRLTKASLTSNPNLVVKVSISKGSSILDIMLNSLEFLKEGFNGMESKHKALTIIGSIFLGVTAYSTENIFDRYMTMAENTSNNQTQQALFETFENIAKHSSAPYMHALVRRMDANDTISVNTEEYTKKEALETFRKGPLQNIEKEAQTFYIDEKFEVVAVYFETSEVQLKIGNRKIKATTVALSSTDKQKLYEEYRVADENNYIPSIDLQVSVSITQGKIQTPANIVGLGQKRTGTITLSEALLASEK